MRVVSGPAPVFTLKGGEYTGECENTYSVSTNEENKKILAYLDQDMPLHTYLTVRLSPPDGAKSTGWQTLSTTPVDLVIEISRTHAENLPMLYRLSAEREAGVVSTTTRIVTFTMTDN